MEVPLFEFAECMNTDPGTVERWIRQGRIPVKRKGDSCIFNREVLEKWAAAHNIRFVMPGKARPGEPEIAADSLVAAMASGGVHYDVPGRSVSEVLRAAADRLEGLPDRESRDILYEKLIDREQMMSTGIGKGVAVPHPRTPLQDKAVDARIGVCFLETPVDFRAVDKKPVDVLFVLVTPTARQHLHLLSRISFCLREDAFLRILNQRPDRERFLKAVAEFENRLDQGVP